MRKVALLILLLLALPAFAQHSVTLSWTQSTDVTTSNKVYRGTVSGGPYTSIFTCSTPCTSYTDIAVSSGQVLYYVVTALNGTTESAFSNESKAVIPQAAPTLLNATPK